MIGDPMKQPNEYVPSLEAGERLPADISAEDSVRAWIDLMRTADKLMLARFAQEVGEENAESAYRDWLNAKASRPVKYKEEMARKINMDRGEHVD